jgi:creatinine amidohydrolase
MPDSLYGQYEPGRDLVLASLSWPEVAEIRDNVEVVLLPTGSNEQHGPNIALSMDISGAYEFCRRASQMAYPRLLVAPPMPWGVSYHHMNFPGTITLSTDTFIQILVEVVDALAQHGFRRFLVVNGHGGNEQALGVACVRVHEELDVDFIGSSTYFSFADKDINEQFDISGIIGHACEMETSVAMYLAPHIVKHDELAEGGLTDLARGFMQDMKAYDVTVPHRFDEYTTNGAFGDARKSSLAYGTALMESALRNFVAFTDKLVSVHPRSDRA